MPRKKPTARQIRNEGRKRIPKVKKHGRVIESYRARFKKYIFIQMGQFDYWGTKHILYANGKIERV